MVKLVRAPPAVPVCTLGRRIAVRYLVSSKPKAHRHAEFALRFCNTAGLGVSLGAELSPPTAEFASSRQSSGPYQQTDSCAPLRRRFSCLSRSDIRHNNEWCE